MKKLGSLLVLSLAFGAGCASTEFQRKPTQPGQALIYVYRPANMLGAMVNGAVTLTSPNGFVRTFPLRNDKYVATVVPAGDYTLNVIGAWGKVIASNMPIQASDGSASFVRCVFHKSCEQLPESVGGPQVAKCRENVAGD